MSKELTREAISKIVEDEELTGEETIAVAEEIMSGGATPCQIGAFITALRMKGETVEQIGAFAKVMREKAAKITPPEGPVLDTVGTGGDGSGTFNISTAAAIVSAGAGAVVAKHGNRGVTSRSGSADVLKALGVKIDAPVEVTEKCLKTVGLAFLFAPVFHSAMKHAVQPRKELGIRTIFNLLGPLSNPAQATHQMIGVYDSALTEPFCKVLRNLGAVRALVVNGSDGLDEITTTTATEISELRESGDIVTYAVDPGDYDIPLAESADLVGGEPEENADIIREILDGKPGPKADITRINAAASLYVVGLAESIEQGLEIAEESIQSGKAKEKLENLIRLSNE